MNRVPVGHLGVVVAYRPSVYREDDSSSGGCNTLPTVYFLLEFWPSRRRYGTSKLWKESQIFNEWTQLLNKLNIAETVAEAAE